MIARADDDAQVDQALYALVDGCARNATFRSYILERDACILGYDFQNLTVKIIYLLFVFLSNSKQI